MEPKDSCEKPPLVVEHSSDGNPTAQKALGAEKSSSENSGKNSPNSVEEVYGQMKDLEDEVPVEEVERLSDEWGNHPNDNEDWATKVEKDREAWKLVVKKKRVGKKSADEQDNAEQGSKNFYKKPYYPPNRAEYPGFPDLSGLSEEEADKKVRAFWKKRCRLRWKAKRNQLKKESRTSKRRSADHNNSGVSQPPAKRVDTKATPASKQVKSAGSSGKASQPGKWALVARAKSGAGARKEPNRLPFEVHVHLGRDVKATCTEPVFLKVVEKIQSAWMVAEPGSFEPNIDGFLHVNGRGVIKCCDEKSRDHIKTVVSKIEIEGKTFRAWSVGESDGFSKVSVRLGPEFGNQKPEDVIRRATRGNEVPEGVKFFINGSKNLEETDQGRLIWLAIDAGFRKHLEKSEWYLKAGISRLRFRPLGGKATEPAKPGEASEAMDEVPSALSESTFE